LGPALAGGDGAAETAADCVLKGAVAERAADQFGAAQRGEGGIIGVRIEKIGEGRAQRHNRPLQPCGIGRAPDRFQKIVSS